MPWALQGDGWIMGTSLASQACHSSSELSRVTVYVHLACMLWEKVMAKSEMPQKSGEFLLLDIRTLCTLSTPLSPLHPSFLGKKLFFLNICIQLSSPLLIYKVECNRLFQVSLPWHLLWFLYGFKILVLIVCVYVHDYSTCRNQKKSSDPLEVEW